MLDSGGAPNGSRLAQQLAFVAEIERLKHVVRATLVLDGSRCENSAEHSWQLAMMALLLGEYAPAGTDLGHVLRLLLVHDLVEIYAGDTPIYDEGAQIHKKSRELAAAARLFSQLPEDQARSMRSLWEEFEACGTAEASFANALDRLQPALHNLWTQGKQWRRHGTTHQEVIRRNQPVREGAPALYQHLMELVGEAVKHGHLQP